MTGPLPTTECLDKLAKRMLLCFLTESLLLVRTDAERALITPPIFDSALNRFFNDSARGWDIPTTRLVGLNFKMSDQRAPILQAEAPMRLASSWLSENSSRFGIVVERHGGFGRQIPESLADRCSMSTDLALPIFSILAVLEDVGSRCSLSNRDLASLRSDVQEAAASVDERTLDVMVRMVRATRPEDPEYDAFAMAEKKVRCGLSSRALLDLRRIAAAHAVIDGRSQICDKDLVSVFPYIANHRIAPSAEANFEKFEFTPALKLVAERALF